MASKGKNGFWAEGTGNVHICLTLRRVRLRTFAAQNQEILHILSVCL